MTRSETGWRIWWAEHSPAERAALQRLDGHENPREVLDVIEDPDGIPISARTIENPDHGTVRLPGYLLGWDPNDDDPTTEEDE